MLCCLALLFNATRHLAAQSRPVATAEGLWLADDGQHINCHGGNIIQAEDGTYCWYGEHRVENIPGASEDGIALYTSRDLKTWHYEGLVLQASPDTLSDIALGCIMERPKVVKNPKTGKYVMLFHLELRRKGYAAARTGFAVANQVKGPFRFVRSLRPNAGRWPADFKKKDKAAALALKSEDYKTWWTPQWREAIQKGLFLVRDMKGGQMSRDMTVYVDDNGRAYHCTPPKTTSRCSSPNSPKTILATRGAIGALPLLDKTRHQRFQEKRQLLAHHQWLYGMGAQQSPPLPRQ